MNWLKIRGSQDPNYETVLCFTNQSELLKVWHWRRIQPNWASARCLGCSKASWLCLCRDGGPERRPGEIVKILISKIPLCPSPSQVLLILTQDAVRELDGTRLCGNRCKVSPNYLTLPVKIQSWKVNFSGWDEQWRKRWKIREVSLKEPKEEESCQEEQVAQYSSTASPFSLSSSCIFPCEVNLLSTARPLSGAGAGGGEAPATGAWAERGLTQDPLIIVSVPSTAKLLSFLKDLYNQPANYLLRLSPGEEVGAGAGARPRRGGIPGVAAGPYCDKSSRLKSWFCSWFKRELFAVTSEQFVSHRHHSHRSPAPKRADSKSRSRLVGFVNWNFSYAQ